MYFFCARRSCGYVSGDNDELLIKQSKNEGKKKAKKEWMSQSVLCVFAFKCECLRTILARIQCDVPVQIENIEWSDESGKTIIKKKKKINVCE